MAVFLSILLFLSAIKHFTNSFVVISHKIKLSAIKKFELEVEYQYDFLLYGIVSVEKSHRLIWHINHIYPYQFVRIDDYELDLNNKPLSFSRYLFTYEENHLTYCLLANKDDNNYLIPELKNFDYLLTVKGALDFFDEEGFKNTLNELTVIQLAYVLEVDKLKSKENLLSLT